MVETPANRKPPPDFYPSPTDLTVFRQRPVKNWVNRPQKLDAIAGKPY
jgi:hypothetical protein